MQEPNEELSRRHLRRQAGDQAASDASGDVTMTRQESLELAKKERQEMATRQLKRRLNWVILGLVVAIVIVYLILFFVG
ncbi:hypothetical protein [Limosilactobacillus fermentum]|uniref:hypothetical protein n=1 Tax=Limosilactobacillus fermentum TaxID=1613 RepID=UPI0021A60F77|nr:hypothetical protein [Limosilactobacillus fermentum]MCT2871425.1 hypothetical protein [Limosilactobacillus fermentum]